MIELRREHYIKNLSNSKAMELYANSFPFHEQREFFSQENVMQLSEYHFDTVYDNEEFIGLVLYWETDDFIYIEHLCVEPLKRNNKYGQMILSKLQQKRKIIILEIDPPVDDISMRRKRFYEKCGFTENDFIHIHPPYHKGNSGHKLTVMTFPHRVTQPVYDEFYKYLCNTVMKNVFR